MFSSLLYKVPTKFVTPARFDLDNLMPHMDYQIKVKANSSTHLSRESNVIVIRTGGKNCIALWIGFPLRLFLATLSFNHIVKSYRSDHGKLQ